MNEDKLSREYYVLNNESMDHCSIEPETSKEDTDKIRQNDDTGRGRKSAKIGRGSERRKKEKRGGDVEVARGTTE